jgi:hypothetical protein
MAAIGVPLDFLGINYYFRQVIASDGAHGFVVKPAARRRAHADGLGGVPDGLRDLLLEFKQRYPDAAADLHHRERHGQRRRGRVRPRARRAARALLQQPPGGRRRRDAPGRGRARILRVVADGQLRVGYGYEKRFGLVHVDYGTQVRTPKDSALAFSQFLQARRAGRLKEHQESSRDKTKPGGNTTERRAPRHGLALARRAAGAHARPTAPRCCTGGPPAASPRPSRNWPTPTRQPAAPGSIRRSPAASRRAPAAINRMVGGTPPTAAQFNTSKQFLDLIDQGMLNNVDVVAAKNNWDKDPARADPELDQDQGPLLRGARRHPHAGVVLVFEARVRQGRHRRRAEDARRVLRRPRQAEGRRHRAARLRRPAVAGEDHVLRVARARRRPRHVHEAVPRQGRRDGGVAAVQGAARVVQAPAQLRRRRARPTATGTTPPRW